jgi:hypothetical protein
MKWKNNAFSLVLSFASKSWKLTLLWWQRFKALCPENFLFLTYIPRPDPPLQTSLRPHGTHSPNSQKTWFTDSYDDGARGTGKINFSLCGRGVAPGQAPLISTNPHLHRDKHHF